MKQPAGSLHIITTDNRYQYQLLPQSTTITNHLHYQSSPLPAFFYHQFLLSTTFIVKQNYKQLPFNHYLSFTIEIPVTIIRNATSQSVLSTTTLPLAVAIASSFWSMLHGTTYFLRQHINFKNNILLYNIWILFLNYIFINF